MGARGSSRARLRRVVAWSGIAALAAALAIASRPASLSAALHIGLVSSVPAKIAHVTTPPSELRLTFSGPIDVKVLAIGAVAGMVSLKVTVLGGNLGGSLASTLHALRIAGQRPSPPASLALPNLASRHDEVGSDIAAALPRVQAHGAAPDRKMR